MNLQIQLNEIPNAIHQLITDPTSNLVASSLGLAIIVIALLILAVIALVFLLPHENDEDEDKTGDTAPDDDFTTEPDGMHEEPNNNSTTPRRTTRWTRLAIVGALAVVALVSAYRGTSTAEYCGNTCHSMVTPAKSWKTSSHAKVDCVTCHETSVLSGTASRVRHVVDASLGGNSVPKATVNSSTCLKCHEKVSKQTISTDGGVRVRHSDFLAAGMACDECHESVGHAASSTAQSGTMSTCLRCHDGDTAVSKCSICHIGDVGRAVVMQRDFTKVELPTPTCGGCHPQTECDACHGLRMPHPANFADPHQHARLAAFGGREKLCYRCHTAADCNRCHVNIGSGHAADWITYHQSYKRSDGNGYCLACHKTKDFCSVCH